jgi:hypothetical protein
LYQSSPYKAAIPPANIAMLAKHAAGIVTIIEQVIQKSSYVKLIVLLTCIIAIYYNARYLPIRFHQLSRMAII